MLEVGVSLPDYMVSHPTRQQYPTDLDIYNYALLFIYTLHSRVCVRCVKYLHMSREKRLKCNNPYRKQRWC